MSRMPCAVCDGLRLKPEALAVKLNKMHISQVLELSIKQANLWFKELPEHLKRNSR